MTLFLHVELSVDLYTLTTLYLALFFTDMDLFALNLKKIQT